MIEVTPKAQQELAKVLADQEKPALRLFMAGFG